MLKAFLLGLALCAGLRAQLLTRPSVQAAGSATVSVPPDQATLEVTVTTNGSSAQDAATKNANQVSTLITALTNLLGANATITTASYSVYPVYQSTVINTPATITGYAANSIVQIVLSNLTQAGAAIDTSVANGATSIGGISFSLKNPEPQREQALQMATQQAMAHATSMATASGHTVGAIRSLQEGSIIQVSPIVGVAGTAASASTSVQPAQIQVQETVTLTADLN